MTDFNKILDKAKEMNLNESEVAFYDALSDNNSAKELMGDELLVKIAREVAEKMLLRRTEGVIVNVSSISSSGNAGQTSYSASKAAVDALTVTWAQELANLKIRVAGVAPGMTDTQMPQNSMKASVLEDWINTTPMNRMAHSSEIADGVLFVLKNDFVCGRVIQIDGGLRM